MVSFACSTTLSLSQVVGSGLRKMCNIIWKLELWRRGAKWQRTLMLILMWERNLCSDKRIGPSIYLLTSFFLWTNLYDFDSLQRIPRVVKTSLVQTQILHGTLILFMFLIGPNGFLQKQTKIPGLPSLMVKKCLYMIRNNGILHLHLWRLAVMVTECIETW